MSEPGKDNKLLLSYNPEECWIQDLEKDKSVQFIFSNYKDNPFLEDNYIKILESLKDEDLKMDGHLYIQVSAENHPYTMPFAGLVGVWLVGAPAVNPPKRNPDNIHYWDADDSNPTFVEGVGPNGQWFIWVGLQTEDPPDSGWETETEVYCEYAPADQQTYKNCIFYETK